MTHTHIYLTMATTRFIFPGVGMGASVSGASRITDETLYASALALASSLTPQERANGQVCYIY
jgi:malate dehydrogenase (oxaloacetate-decarboxylating)(NADP+)